MRAALPRSGANDALRDVSLWGVLGGNALTLCLAVALDWPAREIMWIYWQQSVAIGATNFIRMRNLKEFSTKGLTSNGRPVPETPEGARSTANFFALHYGFFHLGYAVFLFAMPGDESGGLSALDRLLGAVAVVGLVASHVFSLRYNAARDFRARRPNLGALMFYPYLRILPMHLTIILGGAVAGLSLPLFMLLKTLADGGMHVVEHRIFQAKSPA